MLLIVTIKSNKYKKHNLLLQRKIDYYTYVKSILIDVKSNFFQIFCKRFNIKNQIRKND